MSLPKALYAYGDHLARITGFRDWQYGNTIPLYQYEAIIEQKAFIYAITEHYDKVAEAVWSDMKSRPNYYIGGALIGPALGVASEASAAIITATIPIKIGGSASHYIHHEINPFH